MERADITDLLHMSKEIGRVMTVIGGLTGNPVLPDEAKDSYKKVLTDLSTSLEKIDFLISHRHVERIFREFDGQINSNELLTLLSELYNRMYDEAEEKYLVSTKSSGAKYFKIGAKSFGEDLQNKFPSAQFELEEATRCLAFERPTAAVFHLMRILEIGIAAISKCVGIPDPVKPAQRNWGAIQG